MLHLIHTKNLNIHQQLKIEEALLRADDKSWCIINEGSSLSIVLGISNKIDKHLNLELVKKNKIPIIRRFSGGGSVIVDENTIFVSFIFSKKDLIFIKSFPEPIMQWMTQFYQKCIQAPISFKENDFIIGEKKCAGNAQYICKNRWLHHTSFLWDFEEKNMDFLFFPPKTPQYRKKRSHNDFLYRLKKVFPNKNLFIQAIKQELSKKFEVKEKKLEDIIGYCKKPHRKTTKEC